MNQNENASDVSVASSGLNWFCLRSQPKREHFAARNLKRVQNLQLFNPRLRIRKLTARGPVWFTESLFPNYLFARFELSARLEEVKFTMGVSRVLHFGDRYPVIPEAVIEELRKNFGEKEMELSPEFPDRGDMVTLTDPKFYGFQATVLRIMPAKQRVQVLLEILGRTTSIELSIDSVMAERKPLPATLFLETAA